MGTGECLKDVESGVSGTGLHQMLLKQGGEEWLAEVRRENGEIVVRLEERNLFWTMFRVVLVDVVFLVVLFVGMYLCLQTPSRVDVVMVPE